MTSLREFAQRLKSTCAICTAPEEIRNEAERDFFAPIHERVGSRVIARWLLTKGIVAQKDTVLKHMNEHMERD